MADAPPDYSMDYVEFGATDLEATKQFYRDTFGWTFTDYGSEYTSFSDGRLSGGFTRGRPVSRGALVVLYARDLDAAYERVKANGGRISQEVFEFPGGRRFHFLDPSGNELAVWS